MDGAKTVEDVEAGAEEYLASRREWGPYVVAFAEYMFYDWHEGAAQETAASQS